MRGLFVVFFVGLIILHLANLASCSPQRPAGGGFSNLPGTMIFTEVFGDSDDIGPRSNIWPDEQPFQLSAFVSLQKYVQPEELMAESLPNTARIFQSPVANVTDVSWMGYSTFEPITIAADALKQLPLIATLAAKRNETVYLDVVASKPGAVYIRGADSDFVHFRVPITTYQPPTPEEALVQQIEKGMLAGYSKVTDAIRTSTRASALQEAKYRMARRPWLPYWRPKFTIQYLAMRNYSFIPKRVEGLNFVRGPGRTAAPLFYVDFAHPSKTPWVPLVATASSLPIELTFSASSTLPVQIKAVAQRVHDFSIQSKNFPALTWASKLTLEGIDWSYVLFIIGLITVATLARILGGLSEFVWVWTYDAKKSDNWSRTSLITHLYTQLIPVFFLTGPLPLIFSLPIVFFYFARATGGSYLWPFSAPESALPGGKIDAEARPFFHNMAAASLVLHVFFHIPLRSPDLLELPVAISYAVCASAQLYLLYRIRTPHVSFWQPVFEFVHYSIQIYVHCVAFGFSVMYKLDFFIYLALDIAFLASWYVYGKEYAERKRATVSSSTAPQVQPEATAVTPAVTPAVTTAVTTTSPPTSRAPASPADINLSRSGNDNNNSDDVDVDFDVDNQSDAQPRRRRVTAAAAAAAAVTTTGTRQRSSSTGRRSTRQ